MIGTLRRLARHGAGTCYFPRILRPFMGSAEARRPEPERPWSLRSSSETAAAAPQRPLLGYAGPGGPVNKAEFRDERPLASLGRAPEATSHPGIGARAPDAASWTNRGRGRGLAAARGLRARRRWGGADPRLSLPLITAMVARQAHTRLLLLPKTEARITAG